jgi:hypothetical protein
VDEKFMLRLFAVVTTLVLLAWLVAVAIAPIFAGDGYVPAPEINIALMAIVGLFVKLYTSARNSKGDDDE